MSQPAEPTPAAPATPPTPPAPPAPAPAPPAQPPAATPPAPAGFDPKSLSPEAQAWLKQQISDADHKARTNARTAAAQQAQQDLAAKLAPLLGLGGQQLTAEQLVEQAENAAYRATIELALHRHAGADHAKTLIDSVAFLNTVDDIDADVGTPEFDTALEAKIKETLAARGLTAGQPATPSAGQGPATAPPGQGSGPRPDPTQGTRGTPPATRPTSMAAAIGAHYKPG